MQAIICDDMKEFAEISTRLWRAVCDRDNGVNSTNYADPITHPDTGDIALVVIDTVQSFLTDAEKARLIVLDASWTPEIIADEQARWDIKRQRIINRIEPHAQTEMLELICLKLEIPLPQKALRVKAIRAANQIDDPII